MFLDMNIKTDNHNANLMDNREVVIDLSLSLFSGGRARANCDKEPKGETQSTREDYDI